MLLRLHIENLALIDKTEIEFGLGLNVLTGETGAGKSIMIDSITAIIGGRLSRDLIRTGAEKAIVEGLFLINAEEKIKQLEEYGIAVEEDKSILIVREFFQNGKNICRVNGRMVTVTTLKQLGQLLIDIHGQHDNQSLLETQSHIAFLDSFIGQDIEKLKIPYIDKLNKLNALKNELTELAGSPEERARKLDLLEFQTNEISSARLKPNEENELEQKRLTVGNSEKILNSLSKSYELISGETSNLSIVSSINSAIKEIGLISFIDEKYENTVNMLEEVNIQLQEISSDVRAWRDEVEFNPQLLDDIDERLDLIARLKRKYGKDIESVLAYYDKVRNELEELRNSEGRIIQINNDIKAFATEMLDICREMSSVRRKHADVLSNKIEIELDNLEMKNTRFIVNIVFNNEVENCAAYRFTHNGLDKVEFLISPNIGEEPKPLAKIASGGEMSRIMLAIKTILAAVDKKPTLIFDEIDTGISGKTAQAVAEKLSYISFGHQVICVTHLAQIAAMADLHFNIEKITSGMKTSTNVTLVTGKGHVNEIARILGGKSITDTTIRHAEEIKEQSEMTKKQMMVDFGIV